MATATATATAATYASASATAMPALTAWASVVSVTAVDPGDSVAARARALDRAVSARRPDTKLVAVSKFHHSSAVREAHAAGLSHFAENYMQELVAKAQDLRDLDHIRWHFVGKIQSKRTAKTMVRRVPALWCVETVEKDSICDALDTATAEIGRAELHVMIQINTSGEQSKSGLPWQDLSEIRRLAEHILENCPHLVLHGLMTIGAPGDLAAFERLKAVKAALPLPGRHLKLSMGMSGDYMQAIDAGSDQVRVGTAIFGPRPATRPTAK